MDSVNKYGSDGIPFTGKIAEIAPMEQQLQRITDALASVIQSITDELVPLIEECIETISELWDAVLKEYPDKRIVWLAFHHKKERVRKKNRNRIIKYCEKAVNRSD